MEGLCLLLEGEEGWPTWLPMAVHSITWEKPLKKPSLPSLPNVYVNVVGMREEPS